MPRGKRVLGFRAASFSGLGSLPVFLYQRTTFDKAFGVVNEQDLIIDLCEVPRAPFFSETPRNAPVLA